MSPRRCTMILACAFTATSLQALGQSYTSTKFHFPAEMASNGIVSGMSRGGRIFGSFNDAKNDTYLFSKAVGGAPKLHDLGATGAVLALVGNDSGELAGALNFPTTGAFTLTGHKFHLYHPATFSFTRGLDNAGDVLALGENELGTNSFALLRPAATGRPVRYEVPGGANTTPTGTNNSFAVVGYNIIKGHRRELQGFLYQNGVTSTITGPGQTVALPIAINDAGTIALISGANNYLFDGTSYTTVAVPGANRTTLGGLNNAGGAFGIYTDAANVTHGFVYKNGNYASIDAPAGFEVASLLGLDDAGDVLGDWWKSPAFERVAFVATCSGNGC